MDGSSLRAQVTESFYAWEVRGRGWLTADYPVALEPPFRTFFLLPGYCPHPRSRIDDGKRHTLLSRLASALAGEETETPLAAARFEEQPPFESVSPGSLVTFLVTVPRDFALSQTATADLLAALATAAHPVSFELIGAAGVVSIQITVAEMDAPRVLGYLESYAPEVIVTQEPDALASAHRPRSVVRMLDLGLSDEFFLPLRTSFSVDPYVALLPALAEARRGEFLALQVLFCRLLNPWQRAVRDALDDGDGGCIIEDAPWFLRAAAAKTAMPLVAAVVRFGAQADAEARAISLLRGVEAFVGALRDPGGNELMPLIDSGAEPWTTLITRQSYRTGMVLSTEELAGFVHVPGDSVRSSALARSGAKSFPAPRAAQGHSLVLGTNDHRGVTTPVTLDLESRFAHTWIIGGSGTGKSTLLANLILQDIDAGHGVALIDVHGDLVDDVAARIPMHRRDDVILFDPADAEYPIGFNILHASSELEATVLGADLVSIFRRLSTSWGDTMSTVLGEAVLAMLHHPEGGSLLELRRFLVEDSFRASWLAEIPDPDVRYFWEHQYPAIGARSVGPLLTRLDGFLRMRLMRNIVGVRRPALDIGAVMNEGKVLLVRLAKGEIGEENAVLLGSLLLAKLASQALMRQALAPATRRPFFTYLDEVQHFVVPSVESLATEGRKYRVGLVLAHQTRAQLAGVPTFEGALLANCHTRIVFRVGDDDARTLAKGFAHFEEEDLTSLGRGHAIVRVGARDADCSLRTSAQPAVDQNGAPGSCEAIRAATRARFASRTEVLAGTLRPNPSANASAADHDRAASPPRVERARAAPRKEAGLVPATPGRGGQMHKYLQHLVKRLAEERGFRATIEGAAGDGQVDVLLVRDALRVGVEISITTDPKHEIENLRKCVAAGFERIIFISPEKKARTKVGEVAAAQLKACALAVIGPEDVVSAIEALGPAEQISETVVRGINVRVTRKALSPGDAGAQQRVVAGVIARAARRT